MNLYMFLNYINKFWFLSVENLYLRILKKNAHKPSFLRPCPCWPLYKSAPDQNIQHFLSENEEIVP